MKLVPFKRKKAESSQEAQDPAPNKDGEAKTDAAAPRADPTASQPPQPAADPAAEGAVASDPSGDPVTALPNLSTESEPAPGAAPEAAANETAPQAPESPQQRQAPTDDLLAQMSAEAESEVAAEEAALDGQQPSEDDELDPELLDIFRDAKKEVQESSLASELEDISAQELVSEAATISQRLGMPEKRSASDSDRQAAKPSSSEDAAPPDGGD